VSADKEVVNQIIIAVVIAVLTFGIVWKVIQKPKVIMPVPEIVRHGEKIDYNLADKNKSYDINDRSYKQQRLNGSSVVLEGITVSPEQTATFNGKIYRVSEIVHGCKIVDIREDQVLIDKEGEIKYIKMGETLDKL
jgi:Tfp pilus assembly major pilin PilA